MRQRHGLGLNLLPQPVPKTLGSVSFSLWKPLRSRSLPLCHAHLIIRLARTMEPKLKATQCLIQAFEAYPAVVSPAVISSIAAGSSMVAGIFQGWPSAILCMGARRFLPARVLGR